MTLLMQLDYIVFFVSVFYLQTFPKNFLSHFFFANYGKHNPCNKIYNNIFSMYIMVERGIFVQNNIINCALKNKNIFQKQLKWFLFFMKFVIFVDYFTCDFAYF